MYPRYSKSSGNSGRLAAFTPTFVPRANKGRLPPSVWNQQHHRSRPKSNPPPQPSKGTKSYFVSGGGPRQKQQQTRSKSLERGAFANHQRSKSASGSRRDLAKVVHFTTSDPEDNEEEEGVEDEAEALAEYLISRKPSAIYRYNSVQFLNSLRNFRQSPAVTTVHQHHQETTALSRHYRMSKDILDSFVRVKTAQIEGLFGEPREKQIPTQMPASPPAFTNGYTPTTTTTTANVSHQNDSTNSLKTSPLQIEEVPKDVVAKQITSANDNHHLNLISPLYSESELKRTITPTTTIYHRKHPSSSARNSANTARPKSASVLHQRRNGGRLTSSKSTSKLHSGRDHLHQNGHENGDHTEDPEDEALLEPFYQNQQRRSLDQISSIANWERQIRYELEIEKELQKRELDRQREKLASDQRKLEDWDKQLRIELDARERKIRLSEEELRSRVEEFTAKSAELMRREQMISEIVAERLKAEMKFEIEKLRKKFNELEADKSSLAKKEERVKEVEARLHEQVKIVKEKIDSKRLTDIELARAKKELEIVKKENEVLKEKVDSMEDYQVTRFENRAMKGELAMLRESLELRTAELERDRERWEREQRASDQKMIALKGELRKAEQELVISKQKAEGDLEEASSKYEAVSGQLKRLQAFVREHIAKLNSDFSSTAHTVNAHHHYNQHFMPNGTIYPGAKQRQHFASSLHLHRLGRSSRGSGLSSSHQRSVSMDGHEYLAARTAASKNNNSFSLNSTLPASGLVSHRTPARGCRLCNDEEEELCDQLEHDLLLDEDENEYLAPPTANLSRNASGNVLLGYDNIEEEDLVVERQEDTTEKNEGQQPSQAKQNTNEAEDVFQKIADKVYEKMSSQQQQLSSDNLMSRLLSSLEQTSGSSPKSTNVLQELLTASAAEASAKMKNKPFVTKEMDLDTDEHLLPNYHESTRIEEEKNDLPSSRRQPTSLFEEILASEKGNSFSAGSPFLQSPSKIPVMKSSSGSPPNHQSSPSTSYDAAAATAAAPETVLSERVSLVNDDNNNRVLSKKPSLELEEPTAALETLPTNLSTSAVTVAKEKVQLSRTSSAGSGGDNVSKSDSKSDSFEIDW